MALTTCRECSQQVSTKAAACPYCGIDRPARRGMGLGGLLPVLLIGGCTAAVISYGYSSEAAREARADREAGQASPPTAPAPARPTSTTYHATGSVNVRSGPGTEFDVVNTLRRGQDVQVGSTQANGWAQLVSPGGHNMGYVLASLLTEGPAPDAIKPRAPARPAAPRSDPYYLDAAVRNTGTQVIVTNQSSFAWTNCEVELNAGIFRGGWSQRIARIGPGETVAGGLMAFTRSGGERFNPGAYAVESVDVHCNTPSGRAHANFR